jgi:pimeloyl-ACP methyl ester carboxylesterase
MSVSCDRIACMTTFVLLHGAGDVGWAWHLVAAELEARGHAVVAPDLPCEDPAAGWDEHVAALGPRAAGRVVVAGHSLGGFAATLAAERLRADALVYVTGMVPLPGESVADWWGATGYTDEVEPSLDMSDIVAAFMHDVPPELAAEARRRTRDQADATWTAPFPLAAPPQLPVRFVLCTEDRFFPPAFMRRVVAERLPGVVPDELAATHCAALSRPRELAELLLRA